MEDFIKIVQSKEKAWITDIYYGVKREEEKGHFVSSGALITEGIFISKGTIENFYCEQPLYHRNTEGVIIFDSGIPR